MTQRIRLDDLTSDQLDALYERLADYENRITWHTTCGSCARTLDSAIRETERAEHAEARLSHLQASSEAAGILLTRTTDERDRLRVAVDRVRALHYQDGDYCAICTTDFGRLSAPWPCPTITALDSKEPTP